MLHEPALRRRGFRAGPRIQLADGQAWTFPAPPDRTPATETNPGVRPAEVTAAFDPDCAATVAAVLEAEDEDERLRAELALAILLLASNYDLDPSDYGALLDYPPGDRALAAVQRAFHDLAIDYVRACRPTAEGRPAARGWASKHSDHKTGFDVLLGRIFRSWAWHGATITASLSRLLRSVRAARPMRGA